MSTCWKCGRAVPEGSVECEYGCTAQLPANQLSALDDLEAEAEAALAAELQNGVEAARRVAQHLREMNANAARMVVEIEGQSYLVFVKRQEAAS